MLHWIIRLALMMLLVSSGAKAAAQDEGISQKKQEKTLAKKAKEDKKAKARQEKENHKRHLSIQGKEARKRIKRHTRRADRSGSGTHRDGFPARLFRRKR